MDATYKEYRKQLKEREREINGLKKNFSPVMLQGMLYMVQNEIEHIKYMKFFFKCDNFNEIGRWTHQGVSVEHQGWRDIPQWEMDGKTVKALERKGVFVPVRFQSGFRGKCPVEYKADLAAIKDILVKLGYVEHGLGEAVEQLDEMNKTMSPTVRR